MSHGPKSNCRRFCSYFGGGGSKGRKPSGVGFSTNSDSCGSTLAEVVASGCCERPFVARYHLGNEESTDSYDCVSFIGKAECESMYYIWSDVIGNCPHSASALKSDSAPASGPALLTTVLAAAAAAL